MDQSGRRRRWHRSVVASLTRGCQVGRLRRASRTLVRGVLLGTMVGGLAGASSFVFLEVLDRATRARLDHGWLVWLLPVAGLGVGLAYHHVGGRAGQGTALLVDELHEPTHGVPRRMAPMVLVGTWVTHLFGGSAGREGTAVQLSGSLADAAARLLRLPRHERRLLLVAGMSGGFGAVFGVPVAGTVFGLEVAPRGRVRRLAVIPAASASLVGDAVVRALGYRHAARSPVRLEATAATIGAVAVAGLAFGLTGAAFAALTHAVRRRMAAHVGWPPARPVVGGAAVVVLAVLVGRPYLGLSLPLLDDALAGVPLGPEVFALKAVFTAITLGSGFPGGEVTPLFVIGATLGSALAGPLHLPVAAAAAIGMVAVFAGAARTPVTCTVLGAELFGLPALVPFAVACAVASAWPGHHGIYGRPRRPPAGAVTASGGAGP